jgi:hypothetical protein
MGWRLPRSLRSTSLCLCLCFSHPIPTPWQCHHHPSPSQMTNLAVATMCGQSPIKHCGVNGVKRLFPLGFVFCFSQTVLLISSVVSLPLFHSTECNRAAAVVVAALGLFQCFAAVLQRLSVLPLIIPTHTRRSRPVLAVFWALKSPATHRVRDASRS